MASTISKLGLVSLLASSVLAVPTHHNRHRHAKRAIVWETDIVTDVNVVTDIVYATATPVVAPAAATTPSPVAAAAAISSSAPAAEKVNILNWDEFGHNAAASSTTSSSAVAKVSFAAKENVVQVASSSAAPITSAAVASAAPSTTPAATSSTSTASTSTSSGSSSTGKRGVAYNDVSLANIFSSSAFSWAYDWASSPSGILSSNLEFVPMLWGGSSTFTSVWASAVTSALSSGSTYILGFNEPDHTAQSNMSPSEAAAAWKQYIQPYSSQAKLVSPAVTNGAAPMGLGWMSDFMSACDGCTFDAVAIHWYDAASNVDYFKQHVTDAHTQTGKPVWITEFGCNTGTPDDEVSAFLAEVLPWLDSQDFVERYSYFMASDGNLLSGLELSSYGKTYAATQ